MLTLIGCTYLNVLYPFLFRCLLQTRNTQLLRGFIVSAISAVFLIVLLGDMAVSLILCKTSAKTARRHVKLLAREIPFA